MAKRQTRRTVSVSRPNYEAAKQEAARRGMTIAALVEAGLAAIGVPVVVHPQQSPELAARSAARRAERVAKRNEPTLDETVKEPDLGRENPGYIAFLQAFNQ